jgi:pilus assembly protein Flp/PilA
MNSFYIRKLFKGGEDGATAVEYGLMIGLIAIVIFGAVMSFGNAVTDLFVVPADVFDRA